MGDFQLYTADAVDLMRAMADESIDLIITDVAYESLEKHRAVGTTTRLKQSDASSNEWFPIFRNNRFDEWFREAFRVLKKNAHLYFYCDPETAFVAKPIGEEAGFKFWKPLVWAKTKQGMTPDADELTVEHQAMGMGYHYRASYEFVLFFEKGKRKLNDLGVRDLLPFPGVRNGYPTEKPTDLNRVFVRQSSEVGEVVLDPFMGSGSAGLAAVRNGRCFIGGDIKESAVDSARKRLLANYASDMGQLLTIVEGARSPEPTPKKTRTKKVKDVVPLDTAPEPPPPTEPEIECLSCGDSGVDIMADGSSRTCHCRVASRDRENEQLGSKLIPVGAGVLEMLDVSPTPITAAMEEGPGVVAQLDGMFATGPLPGGPSHIFFGPVGQIRLPQRTDPPDVVSPEIDLDDLV